MPLGILLCFLEVVTTPEVDGWGSWTRCWRCVRSTGGWTAGGGWRLGPSPASKSKTRHTRSLPMGIIRRKFSCRCSAMITALFYVATTPKNPCMTQQSQKMPTAFTLLLSVEVYCGKTAHAPISDECKKKQHLDSWIPNIARGGKYDISKFRDEKIIFLEHFKNYFLGDVIYVISAYGRVF